MGRANTASVVKSWLMATDIKGVRHSHRLLRITIRQERHGCLLTYLFNEHLHIYSRRALTQEEGLSKRVRQTGFGLQGTCVYLVKTVDHVTKKQIGLTKGTRKLLWKLLGGGDERVHWEQHYGGDPGAFLMGGSTRKSSHLNKRESRVFPGGPSQCLRVRLPKQGPRVRSPPGQETKTPRASAQLSRCACSLRLRQEAAAAGALTPPLETMRESPQAAVATQCSHSKYTHSKN